MELPSKKLVKPVAIDLFCGPGGFSLGAEMAGFRIVGALDKDKNACLTYHQTHPHTPVVPEDIHNFSPRSLLEKLRLQKEEIDLIIGSPPCRGFSCANRHSHKRDNPENSLMRTFCEFVLEISPPAFIMENVPGILSPQHRNQTEQVMAELEAAGYTVSMFKLRAEKYGVPQARTRVFLAGNLFGEKITAPRTTHDAKPVTVRDAILGDLPRIDFRTKKTVFDYSSEPKSEYQRKMRISSKKIYNHIIIKSGPEVYARYKAIPQGGNWRSAPPELMDITVSHNCLYKRLDPKRPAVTIANFRKSMIVHPTQNRGLSVREAARLQSFPDRYMFLGGITSMQQQVGDAVPPLLAKAVTKQMYRLLRKVQKA